MKIAGVVLLISSLLLFWRCLDAVHAGAHYPARIQTRISPLLQPLLDSIPDPNVRSQKEKEIIATASAVAGEIDDHLSIFGLYAFVCGVVQASLGVYLISKRKEMKP